MSGNDYLYNELLEYCGGDLQEMKNTIEYFTQRLQQELDNEEMEKEIGIETITIE